jgi:hypothetical protein
MQKLHMSLENQEMVRNTLLLLHGGCKPDDEDPQVG